MPHEITLAEAYKHVKHIEGMYHAIYNYTRLQERDRRHIKDAAAQAHLIAAQIDAHERKTRNAQ